MQKIVPHLWFDTQAKEAAAFYVSLFENSKVNWVTVLKDTPGGDSEQVSFQLAGTHFYAISAGPDLKLNPAISLTINCSSIEETDRLWTQLSKDGEVLMRFDAYPFSESYGWLNDRFGVSWQILYAPERDEERQKIVPTLLFTQQQKGKAEAALNEYLSLFPYSSIYSLERYEEGDSLNQAGTVKHAAFEIEGLEMVVMDSGIDHAFTFNPAFSFLVYCEDQNEINLYWNRLSAVPEAEICGWLEDKFGVSWQITPKEMDEMMLSEDEERKQRVVQAFLQMKKIDLQKLQNEFLGK